MVVVGNAVVVVVLEVVLVGAGVVLVDVLLAGTVVGGAVDGGDVVVDEPGGTVVDEGGGWVVGGGGGFVVGGVVVVVETVWARASGAVVAVTRRVEAANPALSQRRLVRRMSAQSPAAVARLANAQSSMF